MDSYGHDIDGSSERTVIDENPWSFQHGDVLTSSRIPREKWNILRDCMEDKGVNFFGFCRMNGKERWKLGLLCGWENMRDN
jgi:hypothetical protein